MNLRKGQNLVDMALILAVAGLVFVGMQTYVKRGVQGRLKDCTDLIISSGQEVAEGAADQHSTTRADSSLTKKTFPGGSSSLEGTDNTAYDYHIPVH